jgi:hypothetical protein
MPEFETKSLKPDVAQAVFANFRWFGWYCKLTPVNSQKTLVRCRRWAWSFFVLSKEDYA